MKKNEQAIIMSDNYEIHYPSRDHLLASLCSRIFGGSPIFLEDHPPVNPKWEGELWVHPTKNPCSADNCPWTPDELLLWGYRKIKAQEVTP